MLSFLLWYVAITLIGWLSLPLAFRFLPGLFDRGYAFARPIGLLIWGYAFWLLASLGVLQNNAGGIFLALLILSGFSFWAGWRDRFHGLLEWLGSHRRLIISAELVFLISFAACALLRAANPDISGTEKPMELAFINAILHSPAFPPHDPWLSGYAISYYYFGYVIVAMLTRLTGVYSGVAFNLAVSLTFAMTALGAYGLVYNLLAIWRSHHPAKGDDGKRFPLGLPLLGPFFILLVSNLEGFLEVLHARGLFWTQNANGSWTSSFWNWLNIQELNAPPPLPLSWWPTRPGGVLYWRASRVLQDFDLTGTAREVIDEFPFFSYLLADLHPHVLAMPFGLLMAALALSLYLNGSRGGFKILGWQVPLAPADFLFAAIGLGGMAFMNTWDFPIYLALVCGAYSLHRYEVDGWSWSRAGEFIRLAIALGVSGAVLYLPFYVGFQSQAGGFLPSLIFSTRGVYFWVMFAPLLLPIIAWLVYQWKRTGSLESLWVGLKVSAVLTFGLWALSFTFAYLITRIPSVSTIFLQNQGAAPNQMGLLFAEAMNRRITDPVTWLTLGLLIAVTWALLRGRVVAREAEDGREDSGHVHRIPESTGQAFPLLLILMGGLLTLGPEFFYLRDQFGGRMNTIFKFYFESWILWGVAAAFGTAILLQNLRRITAVLYRAGLFVLLAMALAYPVFTIPYKTNNFQPTGGLTLNGTAYMERYSPDIMAGIQWLSSAPAGTVVEAVGRDYYDFAEVSEMSGQPGVLGWVGHELQWRGGATEIGSRQSDIETLYTTASWTVAENILRQYHIRYVFVGPLEMSAYQVNVSKFQRYLIPAFKDGNVTVYEVPQAVYAGSSTANTQVIAP